jgi:hypothetical protein
VRSTKTIDVKYEHTPLHKTVAQLIDLLAPPPPVLNVQTPAKKPQESKTPKEPKLKTPRQPKKRTTENGVPAEGEGSQPKKRRRKKDAAAAAGHDGAVLPPEMPRALPVGDHQPRQYYNTDPGASGPLADQSNGAYPEALVSVASDGAPEFIDHAILNLPPGEAARRREVAIKLLTDNGIDPKTLSSEQFSIFANQSPELQQDSLAMLIKYGAARLRVVHPNRDGSTSGQSTPQNQTPAPQVPPETPGSAKSKRSRKKKADGDGVGVDDADTPGPTRTRICDNCREKKYRGKVCDGSLSKLLEKLLTSVQCDRGKPCSMCAADGIPCVYSARKARQTTGNADAAVEGAPTVSNTDAPEQDQATNLVSTGYTESASHGVHDPIDNATTEALQSHAQYDGQAHGTVNQTVSLTDAASGAMVHPPETPSDVFSQTSAFYQHSSGLTFPQINSTALDDHAQTGVSPTVITSTAVEYMSSTVTDAPDPSLHSFSYPQPTVNHSSGLSYGEQTSAATTTTTTTTTKTTAGNEERQQRRTERSKTASGRRNLSNGPASHVTTTTTSSSTVDAQNNWQSMSGSPTLTRSSTRQSKKTTEVSQPYDVVQQQQPTSSWGALNQAVTTPAAQPARSSPSLTTAQPAHNRSRQGNRPHQANNVQMQTNTQNTQSLADTSGFNAVPAQQQVNTVQQAYSNYNQYQTGNTSQGAGQTTSYAAFNTYNTQTSTAAASGLAMPKQQNTASSSGSTSAEHGPTQWNTPNSASPGGTTHSYKSTQPTAAGQTSYNMASTTSQSSMLQGINMQPSAQTRTTTTTGYARQPQNPYTNYVTQQQQQQPRQQTNNAAPATTTNRQGWYGFNQPSTRTSTATSANPGYGSSATTTGYLTASTATVSHTNHLHHPHNQQHNQQAQQTYHHQQPQQQHHHRSMNLSSNTYTTTSSHAADPQALYEQLLRSGSAAG